MDSGDLDHRRSSGIGTEKEVAVRIAFGEPADHPDTLAIEFLSAIVLRGFLAQLGIVLGRNILVNQAKQFAGFSSPVGADPTDLEHFGSFLDFTLLSKERGHGNTDQDRHEAAACIGSFQKFSLWG